jgi:hypothetical protein
VSDVLSIRVPKEIKKKMELLKDIIDWNERLGNFSSVGLTSCIGAGLSRRLERLLRGCLRCQEARLRLM